ncbi:MAG: Spy/CpxP family protein refolding chaperone [Acidobacteriota bacterium]
MTKTKRNVLITGALVLAVALAAAARGPFKNPQALQDLGLTPEQSRKLSDLRYAHRSKMIEERAALEKKVLELKRELDKENPDEAAALRLADEVSSLRARMARERIAHQLEVRKILTPEQWAKVRDSYRGEWGEGRGRGRGAFRGQGPGPRPGFGPGSPGCTGQGPAGPPEAPPEP